MGVNHAYQPFPKPVSTTTVEEMQAKLEARVHGAKATTPPEAGQSPKAKTKLEWEKPAKGATGVKTKCGRYSCSKVTLDGKLTYEVWKLVPGGGWFTPLHQRLDNFLQAQELARQDAEKG